MFFHFVSVAADIHSADSLSLSSQRDDHRVRVLVCVADLRVFKDVSTFSFFYLFFYLNCLLPHCIHHQKTVFEQEVKQQDFFIGTVRVNGRMDWVMLDSAVSQAFKVKHLTLTTSVGSV